MIQKKPDLAENNGICRSFRIRIVRTSARLSSASEPGWMEFRTSGRIADLLHLYGCDEVLTDQQVCKAEARMGVPEGGGMTGVIGMRIAEWVPR